MCSVLLERGASVPQAPQERRAELELERRAAQQRAAGQERVGAAQMRRVRQEASPRASVAEELRQPAREFLAIGGEPCRRPRP